CFFFQAEDGIRDLIVTGVQTCALPISLVSNALAFVLDSAGQKKAAEVEYRAILKSDSNNGLVYNNLAFLIAENGGDLGEALAFAHRAKQLAPDAAAVSDTLGWIYLKKALLRRQSQTSAMG